MKTISGRLYLGKREVAEIKKLIEHSQMDLNQEREGTYNILDKDGERQPDVKEVKMALNAIKNLEWILSEAIN